MEFTNSTKADLLDEDKPIAGQKFACVSFVSPENILKKKELYFFNEFVKTWDMSKSLEKFQVFLNYLCYKYDIKNEDMMTDMQDFMKDNQEMIPQFSVYDDYKTFLDNKEEDLEKKFNKEHSFQTNTRGIKIRGSFPSIEEAQNKAKDLRENDPNHDVFVGPVGLWMPWEPDAYKTGKVEYLEKELNDLMHEKKANDEAAKKEFDQRVKESKEKAIEDNIKKAEESGNVLTQILNEDGNLVNVREVDYDAIPDEDVILPSEMDEKSQAAISEKTSANIKQQLFSLNNVETKEKKS
tara:strand:- start:204 stop:1088 length:885 start_codon:yes stop_codon:yes gene_type:complete